MKPVFEWFLRIQMFLYEIVEFVPSYDPHSQSTFNRQLYVVPNKDQSMIHDT